MGNDPFWIDKSPALQPEQVPLRNRVGSALRRGEEVAVPVLVTATALVTGYRVVPLTVTDLSMLVGLSSKCADIVQRTGNVGTNTFLQLGGMLGGIGSRVVRAYFMAQMYNDVVAGQVPDYVHMVAFGTAMGAEYLTDLALEYDLSGDFYRRNGVMNPEAMGVPESTPKNHT